MTRAMLYATTTLFIAAMVWAAPQLHCQLAQTTKQYFFQT